MIVTKKLGPTNTLGARITAKCADRKVTIPYPHEMCTFDAHMSAAKILAKEMGWSKLAYSDSPDRKGYVFVNANFFGDTDLS